MNDNNVEGDSIDFISLDENPGWVVLHLLLKGPWTDTESTIHWVRRRLNLYIGYVTSGQINANPRFRGLPVKFLVHCELPPPPLALTSFARMKAHLSGLKIALGITVGSDVKTEVPVWDIGTETGTRDGDHQDSRFE